MLSDAALTVLWQEPVSGVYAWLTQRGLKDDLQELERAEPSPVEQRVLRALESDRRRMTFLARALRRKAKEGAALGRLRIGEIDSTHVLVKGTGTSTLRRGPGIYDATVLPGIPGTVGIAGHRTTYGAPFRRLDRLEKGDLIVAEMPYGAFTYAVERKRIVPPSAVSVLDRVSFDRLVLTACHPLYSAAKRIVVFARLVGERPRGAALLTRPS